MSLSARPDDKAVDDSRVYTQALQQQCVVGDAVACATVVNGDMQHKEATERS